MLNTNNSQLRARYSWITFLWAGLIVLVLIGCGLRRPKVVGILSGADAFEDTTDGFIAQMSKLGYERDKNIIYKVYSFNSDEEKERKILNKFVADKVDLIFTFPTGLTLLAKEITRGKNIPVVFAATTIEGNNLVKSVSQPGGNITGVRFPGVSLMIRRFEILLQIAPRTKRVLVIYESGYPAAVSALTQLRPKALSAGITLVEATVNSVGEIEAYLQARTKMNNIGVDAVLMMPGILVHTPESWTIINGFAHKYKLPIVGGATFQVHEGAVFTYIPDNIETGEAAAILADKIFKGTPAGLIPLITPESHLKINYTMVEELNLTVSEALLSQANEVIR